MSKPITVIVLLALAVGAVVAAPASANKVLDDCSGSDTGLLKGSYTSRQLTGALRQLDGDSSDYSNCYDAIRVALSNLRRVRNAGNGGNGDPNTSGGGNGGDTGGGFDAGFDDPADTGDFDAGIGSAGGNDGGRGGNRGGEARSSSPQPPATAQPGSNAPVQLADTSVTPSIPAAIASEGNALPTPLIVLLALLGAGTLAVAGTTIGRRALARRRD